MLATPFVSDQLTHERMVDVVTAEEDMLAAYRHALQSQMSHLRQVCRHDPHERTGEVLTLEVICGGVSGTRVVAARVWRCLAVDMIVVPSYKRAL